MRRLVLRVRLRHARHHATANLRADRERQSERSAAALLATTEPERAHARCELEELRTEQRAYQQDWAERAAELERQLLGK